MDFFMKPMREYMIQRMVLSTNIMNLIKPIAFIGGNMIWKHVLKRINQYNKITVPPPIDITKEYNSKHTNAFLETYKQSNSDMNSNIDQVFYSKEDYTKTMRDINNELEIKWKQKTLIEQTPKGNIIMFYDPYKQGFSYYSDSQPIPYAILNAVAMKYVRIYRCRDFFIDDETTPEKEPSPFIQIHMVEKKKTKDANKNNSDKLIFKDAPFAKLKNYKKEKQLNKTNTETKSDKPERVFYRNKFISLGPIRNYTIIQSIKKENKLNGFKTNLLSGVVSESKLQNEVMNYKDFKLKQQK